MATGFLFDENLPLALMAQLRRKVPTVRIFAVGFGEAPAKSTSDPALLCWLEDHDCWLVTNNRASMPCRAISETIWQQANMFQVFLSFGRR